MIFKVNDNNRNAAIQTAAEALLSGNVVIFPTDTVYGIAAHPDFPEAIEKIYEIKGRPDGKPIAILMSDASALSKLGARLTPKVTELAEKHWPGALTMVIDCAEGKTEGVRIPDSSIARDIIRAAGGILRVTSANLSGYPAQDRITDELLPLIERATVTIDDGICPGGKASTVIKIDKDDTISILRQGAIVL